MPVEDIERLFESGDMSSVQLLGEYAHVTGDDVLAARALEVLETHEEHCGHMGLFGMGWHGPVALTLGKLSKQLGNAERQAQYLKRAGDIARAMRSNYVLQWIEAETDAPAAAGSGEDRTAGKGRFAMSRQGDFWEVSFAGRRASIKNSKGMQILSRLVAEPNREFHALDLNSPTGEFLIEQSGGLDALDERARSAYRQRLEDLVDELENARAMADTEHIESLQAEREQLEQELARAFGLHGRARPGGSAAERARVNVTRRLRDAIQHLGTHLPEADTYLNNCVKTGTYCRYVPL
jgi:hypothetical protein